MTLLQQSCNIKSLYVLSKPSGLTRKCFDKGYNKNRTGVLSAGIKLNKLIFLRYCFLNLLQNLVYVFIWKVSCSERRNLLSHSTVTHIVKKRMIGHLWTLVELPFKGHGGSHWKMTPLNCSFPCKWEVVIVSWTLQGHLSSLGAINNHYYTVQTPYTQAWTQTTCRLIQGCTKQFGWISPLHHGNWLRHLPIQGTPPFCWLCFYTCV